MDVFGIKIPNKSLSNFDLLEYVKLLNIPNFRGVFMRDALPKKPMSIECGIVNFNTSQEPGSHWVTYNKNNKNLLYFDSYGQVVLTEVQNYLKEKDEKIQRNTDIIQPIGTSICGHLCLFVLKALSIGWTFREILDKLSVKTGSGIKWTSTMANELHKPVRKKFPKRFVFVRKVDDIWGADIVDMQSLKNENKGFKYILMVIDIFSKYGWARPLKTKSGHEVAETFKIIFQENTPKKLWTDEGKEFYNKEMSTLLKKHNIHLYSTQNEEKCSVIERWNRTIKTQLWKYFSANGTYEYLDILQPLIDKYNSTKHRSIGFTPSDARKPSNYQQVFKNLFFKKVQKTNIEPRFKIGDRVRISVKKNIFEKGFTINWTDKIYTISQVLKTLPPTYIIKNDRNEDVKGTFYEQELQKTKEELFRIEKVVRWKKINGQKMGRVKWTGYDSSYNSWLPESEITRL